MGGLRAGVNLAAILAAGWLYAPGVPTPIKAVRVREIRGIPMLSTGCVPR
jgi:hypothetical protein